MNCSPISAVRSHFRRYTEMSAGRFFWRITLERLVLCCVVVVPLVAVLKTPTRTDIILDTSPPNQTEASAGRDTLPHSDRSPALPDKVDLSPAVPRPAGHQTNVVQNALDWIASVWYYSLLLTVLVTPLVETLLFQSLFAALSRRLGLGFGWSILVTTIPFAAVHFVVSIPTGVGPGVVGGFYFAFMYVHLRRKSFHTAYWLTAASHAIHNLFIVLLATLGIALSTYLKEHKLTDTPNKIPAANADGPRQ